MSGRTSRKTWILVAGLTAIVAAVPVGIFVFRRTVSVGRHWPRVEQLSIDTIRHDDWSELLGRHVDDEGNVDYRSWKDSRADQARLVSYLEVLSRADPTRESSRPARLAYWINAYNALTVYGILREYPTSSIQNHTGWLSYNIWRDLMLQVGDRSYSLGQIEDEQLRPLNEPRIHFAIVCASRGCPRLLNEPYDPQRLEEQLQRNSQAFFADPTKFQWDATRQEVAFSPILSWYANDFGSSPADVLTAIRALLPEEASEAVSGPGKVDVRYLAYDWSLNDQVAAPSEPEGEPSNLPPLPPMSSE